jgi:tetratricopeptide (TPR) repeat protein
MQGKPAEARTLHAEAVRIYRETGDRAKEARALNNLASALASDGELVAAKKTYETALQVFEEIGDDGAVGTILANLGSIRFDEGDLAGTMELFERARGLFDRAGAQSSLAFVLYRLGDLHLGKGDIARSREHHEKALEIRKRLGEKGSVAESQLGLAQVALHENRPVPAEALAREAIQEFGKEKRLDDKAMGHAVLARALLDQRRVAEAWGAVRSARAQAEASSSPATRLRVETAAASVESAMGNTQSAIATLKRVIAEARRSALPGVESEARLALGRLQGSKSGRD